MPKIDKSSDFRGIDKRPIMPKYPAMPIVIVVGIFLIAILTIILTADEAVPGDLFYPVDRTNESVKIFFIKDAVKHAAFRLDQLDERLREYAELARNNKKNDEMLTQQSMANIQEAIDVAQQEINQLDVSSNERKELSDYFNSLVLRLQVLVSPQEKGAQKYIQIIDTFKLFDSGTKNLKEYLGQ